MKRLFTYAIGPEHAGWTILQFLKQKQYSRSVIIQLKKTENGILVNGTWAYVSHVLKTGDQLVIRLLEQNPADAGSAESLSRSVLSDCVRLPPDSVVYEDQDLLVVNKPAGMPVHPSMEHHGDTLSDAVCRHALEKQEWYPYRCISRLDRDTSGLTVIAKNAYSSCLLYQQVRERAMKRTYYAIVQGRTPNRGTIDAPIARREPSIIARTVDFEQGQHAVTHFETLAYEDELSFLKLALETGRTHQIRVHMLYAGCPLIGDFLYNPKDSRMKRQALHAGNLEFTHPVSGRLLRFSAPLPEDMSQFFHMVIS